MFTFSRDRVLNIKISTVRVEASRWNASFEAFILSSLTHWHLWEVKIQKGQSYTWYRYLKWSRDLKWPQDLKSYLYGEKLKEKEVKGRHAWDLQGQILFCMGHPSTRVGSNWHALQNKWTKWINKSKRRNQRLEFAPCGSSRGHIRSSQVGGKVSATHTPK